ncbi:hypothetical protein PQX77_001629 [Marasmius sp. AFHP31]|nr:hypothetical protein PQX77_001629 [Marasmius sp. AFHP31]
MLLPLPFFCCLLLAAWSEASSHALRPITRLSHPTLHQVKIFPRTPLNSANSKHNLGSARRPLRFDDSFKITFSAFGDTFYLCLKPNSDLVYPHANIITYYDRDQTTGQGSFGSGPLLRELLRVYEGYVVHRSHHMANRVLGDTSQGQENFSTYSPGCGWARVTVYEHEDGKPPVYEGAFSVHGMVHHVMTKENYRRVRRSFDADPGDSGEPLVVWRDMDIGMPEDEHVGQPLPPTASQTCGRNGGEYTIDSMLNRSRRDFSLWPPLSMWQRDGAGDCVSSSSIGESTRAEACQRIHKTVDVGVAADCAYVSKYGSVEAATEKILSDWNSAGFLWKSSLNVSIRIAELLIGHPECPSKPSSPIPWDVNCNTDINRRLRMFSDWHSGKLDERPRIWHLMSGCSNGEEAGIAWSATRCGQTFATDGEAIFSLGVSTPGPMEWQVVSRDMEDNTLLASDCAITCLRSNCYVPGDYCDSISTCGRYNPLCGEQAFTGISCRRGNICSHMPALTSGSNSEALNIIKRIRSS